MGIHRNDAASLLSKYGDDGWELVSALNASLNEAVSVSLFLKRPLEDDTSDSLAKVVFNAQLSLEEELF